MKSVLNKIANLIELERELQDVDITELVKDVGVKGISRQSYYNIRDCKHDVGINKLEGLCKKLNLEITIKNNNNRK